MPLLKIGIPDTESISESNDFLFRLPVPAHSPPAYNTETHLDYDGYTHLDCTSTEREERSTERESELPGDFRSYHESRVTTSHELPPRLLTNPTVCDSLNLEQIA